jgi:hypothetical protein
MDNLTLHLSVPEIQLVLTALSKLPLETSIDTWFKVKSQAEAQVAQAQAQAATQETH